MTTDRQGGAGGMGTGRALLLFTMVQGLLVVGLAVGLQQFVWRDADGARAVQASAWVAFGVQTFAFVVARLVARQQLLAGWGLGVALRFVSVLVWGLLGVKAMGLPSSPALLSLVVFYFASTLVEPLFLT